jgi:glutamate formiminotransferase/formiminotetrahydrofolate cyclodeaminase
MSEAGAGAGRQPLIEIVPNFSEGRRQGVIEAIIAALLVPGVVLLNRQSDPDHNRLDASLVGPPEAVRRSALAGAAKAAELIDMEQHRGSHPRMGAVDVIPFLPIRDVTMDDCVELARDAAREIGETLGIPAYCYDQAALVPERRSLAEVRKGEYEGLKADVAAGRRLPDFGPHEIGRAGAVAVGARKPLVAFNVYLTGDNEVGAKAVARRVRESTGGLKNVRAIGFSVPERGCVTVSMNLVDHEATPIYRAFELVRMEASRYGMEVLSSEIVGLVPQAAVAETAMFYLRLEGFEPAEQILEMAMQRAEGQPAESADRDGSGADGRAEVGNMRTSEFLDALASDAPTPGGGTAAAFAGAAGAALVAMVARLTTGKKGYEQVQERMAEIVLLAEAERRSLLGLADRDAAAFDAVLAAYRMPKETDQERSARSDAIQRAMGDAAAVPLDVARRSAGLVGLAHELTESGNATAASDGAAAGQLLRASVEGALCNVEINVGSIKDPGVVETLRAEVSRIRRSTAERMAALDQAFHRRIED